MNPLPYKPPPRDLVSDMHCPWCSRPYRDDTEPCSVSHAALQRVAHLELARLRESYIEELDKSTEEENARAA